MKKEEKEQKEKKSFLKKLFTKKKKRKPDPLSIACFVVVTTAVLFVFVQKIISIDYESGWNRFSNAFQTSTGKTPDEVWSMVEDGNLEELEALFEEIE